MSKLPWFRLYSRIIDDDKLGLLAFEDRWHFVALCCLKSDGLLDEEPNDLRSRRIAYKLGVQVRELDEIARRLKAVGLIDDALNPVAWDDLQFKSDNSTARVQAYRKKQKKQARNGAKRDCNVSETAQETDADTEQNISPNGDCASGDAPPPPENEEGGLKPDHVADEWNKTAAAIGQPIVRKLTPSRRQLLKARIAQHPLEDFIEVFAKIRGSPFLRGDTARWKGATFDWTFKAANFLKILEGNYDA